MSVVDIACGMYAHTAVLQALFERERTGQGRGVAVSLFDCIADWMTVRLLHQDYGGKAPERIGLNHPSIAPYGAFALADGHTVVISIQNEREWRTFCAEVLEQPDLATDPRFVTVTLRVANRPALDAAVGSFFATLDRAQATERLRRARIAFGSLNSVADLSAHSQLRRITTDTPTGPVTGVAPPPR